MDSHTRLSLRANLVFGGIAFIQRRCDLIDESCGRKPENSVYMLKIAPQKTGYGNFLPWIPACMCFIENTKL